MPDETGQPQMSRKAALALAAAAGVIGVVVGGLLATAILGGNEAPIRIKNASIELRIAGPHHRWQKVGDNRYRVLGPNKNQSDYYLEIEGTGCAVSDYGATVALEHSDGTILQLGVGGNHTEVTTPANVNLTISADEKSLSHSSPGGFLRSVKVNGTERCRFASKADFTYMMLADY